MRRALVVIDMLEDFVHGALANPNALGIISGIAELADAIRTEGGLVVFANDAHLPGDYEEALWGQHALAGTPGAAVIAELAPKEADIILPKRFYGSFYETGLDSILRQNGIAGIVLAGQHTNTCVRHTAYEAFCRGYAISVSDDCVAMFGDMTAEEYLKAQGEALAYLAGTYGVTVVSTWQELV
jgi:nicotinamidase-related amidase